MQCEKETLANLFFILTVTPLPAMVRHARDSSNAWGLHKVIYLKDLWCLISNSQLSRWVPWQRLPERQLLLLTTSLPGVAGVPALLYSHRLPDL